MRKIISATLVLVGTFFWGCTTSVEEGSRVDKLPYYCSADFTPHWLSDDSDSLPNFHQIPAFALTNQFGHPITEKTVTGKIYVVDFFFTTCPGICPKMTTNMAVISEAFKNDPDVLLLSHSVTPETDSVSVLNQYAEDKGINSPQWHLLTGNRKEIYDLGRQWYFVEEDLGYDRTQSEFLHTENFILVDQNRHIRGIYNGLNQTAVDQLILDIDLLHN